MSTADVKNVADLRWTVDGDVSQYLPGFSDPTTTKGDLIVHGATTTRLGVGSDTQILTADSTQTLGVKWAAAPATAVKASTYEQQLTTTGATTVVTFTPTVSQVYVCNVYFRVVTGTTVVTVTVSWTDATGAQTATLVNAVSESTGSYSVVPFGVADVASSAITVTATAGTANQVFMSATITG